MNITVGCLSGLNKVYNIHRGAPVSMFGSLDVNLDLQVMSYGWKNLGDDYEDYLFFGYTNGLVKYYNSKEKSLIREFNFGSNIRSIEPLGENRLLVTCIDGSIHIKEFEDIHTLEPKMTINKVITTVGQGKKMKQVITQVKEPKDDEVYHLLNDNELERELSVNALTLSPDQTVVAFGGKTLNLTVRDMEKQTNTWSAKFQHDFLNLQEPVNVSAIKFLHNTNQQHILIGSDKKLKIYDTKAKRHPIMDLSFSKYQVKAVAVSQKNENIIIGSDVVGNVSAHDKRTGRQLGTYKGNTGSVRGLDIHPTLPLLATVGFDRFLRIFDVGSRKCLHKIFLKQKLSNVLFSREEPVDKDEQDDNEIWQTMENNKNSVDQDDDQYEYQPEITVKEEINSDDDEQDSSDNDINDDNENEDFEFNLKDEDDSDADSEDKKELKTKLKSKDNKKRVLVQQQVSKQKEQPPQKKKQTETNNNTNNSKKKMLLNFKSQLKKK
ncbi:WD40 repeat-containing protein [Tieghemostelium lacteum]|uniref:WD40 repeat-containing protein n=1 Tax=Tieghemostelium lacteum TaxID=361077 RepID=A0A152A999_TIELA|nr:WD40 repeat-containing protein [Tieghemostelium lacteum]|eukprot:KYR02796.1 WD40 repeat-containing protein [Tieghemostelium lacteum]